MCACFLFPTRAIFENVGQAQWYALERSKLRDNRFLHVSWNWAARVERGLYLEGMAEVGAQPLMANLGSSQPKSWGKKKSLTKVCTFMNWFHCSWNIFVPFLSAEIPALEWICTFVCINFKDRFRNPRLKTPLFPELCSSLQTQVFVRPCHAILWNMKGLGFFYPLVGFQEAEDKSHLNFLTHSWLCLSWIVCGTGFNGSSLHFMVPNDINSPNVTDWLFWNFSLN